MFDIRWFPTVSRRRRRRHSAVRQLQAWLNEVGYDVGRVDGVFGQRTDRAVRAVQTSAGLVVDGVCGPRTWVAVAQAVSIQRAEPEPDPVIDTKIVARADWGARPAKRTVPLLDHRPTVYIHHAADPKPSQFGEDAETRKYQDHHMDVRGWWDLAYNFVITPSGRVLEGRGVGVRPGATRGKNAESYAICFQGHFHPPVNEKPTKAAVAACGWLIRFLIDGGHVAADPQVVGHRHVARTACPGDRLDAALPDIRSAAGL